MQLRRIVPIALLLALAPLPAQNRWTTELSLRVQSVGGVIPSSDGSLVAYMQTRHVIEEERSEQVSQVFLAKSDGSSRRQLTFGEKSATAPSFSPDGRFVYFRSARTGHPNIWRIPVDGGEAQRVTAWKGDIGDYAVSPDGKWLAFAGLAERPEEARDKKQKRDFRVIDANPKNHSLWLTVAVPQDERPATPRRLTESRHHVVEFDWAPDSRSIVFEHRPSPSADVWTQADLSEVDIESGAETVLVATRGAESQPRYSPDGRFIAFVQTPDRARWPGAPASRCSPARMAVSANCPHRATSGLACWVGIPVRRNCTTRKCNILARHYMQCRSTDHRSWSMSRGRALFSPATDRMRA